MAGTPRNWRQVLRWFIGRVARDVVALTVIGLIMALILWEIDADIWTYFPALAIMFAARVVWAVGKIIRQSRTASDAPPNAEPTSR